MGPGFESLKVHQIVSAKDAEGPPVPIPNTEVKLCSGDNTRLATAREDSSVLTQRKGQLNLPLTLQIQVKKDHLELTTEDHSSAG